MKELAGKARKFGDNINTDYIIAGKYKFKSTDMNDMAKHLMEDVRPGFIDEIEKGDFIVAGHNFGMGSSRQGFRANLLPQLHQCRAAGH
jgi:3-isopropylmalate/(R)-2-methylmalate dehydratase small subunit